MSFLERAIIHTRSRVSFGAVAVLLALTSCATQKVAIQGMNPGYSAEVRVTQHFFFWGLGQSEELYPSRMCEVLKADLYRLDYSTTFSDALLSVLTVGIYAPKMVTVFCRPIDPRKY